MRAGRAKLVIDRGLSVWLLEAPGGFGEAGYHAHHAIQITISLAGLLLLESRSDRLEGRAIAVASDAEHRFAAEGVLLFVFVEPESAAGRALARSLFVDRELAHLDLPADLPVMEAAGVFDRRTDEAQLLSLGHALVDSLIPAEPAALPDPRIDRIVDHAQAHLTESLAAAAGASGVHLSPSRLRHLFVEQTGLAYKTYLTWLRLNKALQVYSQGRSLTEAAHAAGFADSAHFSRTFRRNFGLPATTLERV